MIIVIFLGYYFFSSTDRTISRVIEARGCIAIIESKKKVSYPDVFYDNSRFAQKTSEKHSNFLRRFAKALFPRRARR